MSNIEILLIGIGLSMDAFSVAVCKGLSIKKITLKKCLTVGLYFGIFQAIMPFLGYTLGKNFEDLIIRYDHWIAFALLLIIGINMIKGAFDKEEDISSDTTFKKMLPLAIATSIDALVIGTTFAFLKVNIIKSIIMIGITTFILSTIGTNLGNLFGNKYKNKAQIIGGIILIIIGIKTLLEHLR